MQLHAAFVRLPRSFDAKQLAAEVNALPVDAWRRHPTGHVGNAAVSLVSRNGDHTDDSIGGAQATTTWLAPDSYLAQTQRRTCRRIMLYQLRRNPEIEIDASIDP